MTGSQSVPTIAWASTARIRSSPGTLRTSDGTAHSIRPSSPTTPGSTRPSIGAGRLADGQAAAGAGRRPPDPVGPAPIAPAPASPLGLGAGVGDATPGDPTAGRRRIRAPDGGRRASVVADGSASAAAAPASRPASGSATGRPRGREQRRQRQGRQRERRQRQRRAAAASAAGASAAGASAWASGLGVGVGAGVGVGRVSASASDRLGRSDVDRDGCDVRPGEPVRDPVRERPRAGEGAAGLELRNRRSGVRSTDPLPLLVDDRRPSGCRRPRRCRCRGRPAAEPSSGHALVIDHVGVVGRDRCRVRHGDRDHGRVSHEEPEGHRVVVVEGVAADDSRHRACR